MDACMRRRLSHRRFGPEKLIKRRCYKSIGNNRSPMFRDHANAGYPMKPDDSVSEEDRRYLGWNINFQMLEKKDS